MNEIWWNAMMFWFSSRVLKRVSSPRCMRRRISVIAVSHLQYLTKYKNFWPNRLAKISFIDCAILMLSNDLVIQGYCDAKCFFAVLVFDVSNFFGSSNKFLIFNIMAQMFKILGKWIKANLSQRVVASHSRDSYGVLLIFLMQSDGRG